MSKMAQVNYQDLFSGDYEVKKVIYLNCDKANYLEKSAMKVIGKIKKKKENVTNKEINEIFVAMLLIQYKNQMRIEIFDEIEEKYQNEFNIILNYILSNFHKENEMNDTQKEIAIKFLILCYDHIDNLFIHQQIIKLCSIFIWVNLSKKTLLNLFKEDSLLIKKFSALGKLNKMENNATLKSPSCEFINKLLDLFLNRIEENTEDININLLSTILIFVTELLSVYQTRKYLLPLLTEKHFIERIKLQKKSIKNSIFHKLYKYFKFYYYFQLDSKQNSYIDKISKLSLSYSTQAKMQSIAYALFPEELSKILTENIAFTDSSDNLRKIISSLSHDQVLSFLSSLNLLKYPESFYDNRTELLHMIFISTFKRRKDAIHSILTLPLYPTEKLLYNTDILPENLSLISQTLIPIPKLSLSYLTIFDYLLKNYLLFKYESSFSIREEINDVIDRMSPSFDSHKNFARFLGWSLMGIPVDSYQIISVKPPLIGEEFSSEIIAEIDINLNGVQTEIKQQWDSLKKFDVLFFVAVKEEGNIIRGGEIISIYDDDNNNIATSNESVIPVGFKRKIMIALDPVQYKEDLLNGCVDLKVSLLIRREAKKNNFKAILESIKGLIKNISSFPQWIELPLLGNNKQIITENDDNFDYFDTFISEEHLKEYSSYANKEIKCSRLKNESKNRNKIRFTSNQIDAISKGVNKGLTLIVGPPGTGKTDVAVQIVNLLHHNYPNEKIFIITHSNAALNDIFEKIALLDIDEKYLLRLGMGSKDINSSKDYSINGRIDYMLNRRKKILDFVLAIAEENKIFLFEEYTCDSALKMIHNLILPHKEIVDSIEKTHKISINECIDDLEELRMFELLRDSTERRNHLIKNQSKIIAMTCTYASLNRNNFIKLNFEYSSVIMEESAQILEIESLIPLTMQGNFSSLKRFVMLGDPNQLPPIIQSSVVKSNSNLDMSMFTRFIRNNNPFITLNAQGRSRSEIVDLFRWRYKDLSDLEIVNKFEETNPHFKYTYQFVNVGDYDGKGEEINDDCSYVNLAEAEYAIGVYMFMCLCGYSPKEISIITTYNGQKELIKEIYDKKCNWSDKFRGIKKISTVDKYQGQQNDYVILSLVRTKNVGYLRDIRRFIVGLSRGRKGVYILGRFELFKNCYEMENIMNKFTTSQNLMISIDDDNYIKVEDFRHMYRIVQELIGKKINELSI